MVRRGVFAAAIVVIALIVANWSKIRGSRSDPPQRLIQVVKGTLKANPARQIVESNQPLVTEHVRHASELETKVTDLTYSIMVAHRQARHYPPSQDMSYEEFNSRTKVSCTTQSCLITASPGKGSETRRELVGLLVNIESGLDDTRFAAIGLRPGKITARIVGGTALVDLGLTKTM